MSMRSLLSVYNNAVGYNVYSSRGYTQSSVINDQSQSACQSFWIMVCEECWVSTPSSRSKQPRPICVKLTPDLRVFISSQVSSPKAYGFDMISCLKISDEKKKEKEGNTKKQSRNIRVATRYSRTTTIIPITFYQSLQVKNSKFEI